jgi:hypothetical protein
LDKETQVNVPASAVAKEDEEEDEEVFVYPTTTKEVDIPKAAVEDEEEEDEEVFVYRGMDAVPSPPATTTTTDPPLQEDISAREGKLKSYYEHQVNNLTEKIQMTDSKALRFSSMYKSMKDRLIAEEKEKNLMLVEIERLNNELKKYQDLLTTTESNYQTQVDTMTEFISQLQQNLEDQQRRPSQSNSSGRRQQQQQYNNHR